MTKIDIFSGFLGAGKTTLIQKLLREAYIGEKLVLIENEFGEIGIDGGFMQDAGIEVTEMNSGCICCSLVGDFGKALEQVLADYAPDRILIEPSGVGKLSDIIRAVQNVSAEGVLLNGFTTVADVKKCKMYMKNFGEFFNDQIENAGCIVLSHTQDVGEEKIAQTVALLREHNPTATIVTTPWDQLDGAQLLAAMERRDTIEEELARLVPYTYTVADEKGEITVTDTLFLLTQAELEGLTAADIFSGEDTSYNDNQVLDYQMADLNYTYVYAYFVRSTDGTWVVADCDAQSFVTKNKDHRYVGIRPAVYITVDTAEAAD